MDLTNANDPRSCERGDGDANHSAIQPEEFTSARPSLRIDKNGQPGECAEERRGDHHRPWQIGNSTVQSATVGNKEFDRVENIDAASGCDFFDHKVEEMTGGSARRLPGVVQRNVGPGFLIKRF